MLNPRRLICNTGRERFETVRKSAQPRPVFHNYVGAPNFCAAGFCIASIAVYRSFFLGVLVALSSKAYLHPKSLILVVNAVKKLPNISSAPSSTSSPRILRPLPCDSGNHPIRNPNQPPNHPVPHFTTHHVLQSPMARPHPGLERHRFRSPQPRRRHRHCYQHVHGKSSLRLPRSLSHENRHRYHYRPPRQIHLSPRRLPAMGQDARRPRHPREGLPQASEGVNHFALQGPAQYFLGFFDRKP